MTATTTKPQLRRIEVPEMGAEDVVIDADGNAWTGTEDGSIFRVTPQRLRATRGSHRWPPARLGAAAPTVGCSWPTPTRACWR